MLAMIVVDTDMADEGYGGFHCCSISDRRSGRVTINPQLFISPLGHTVGYGICRHNWYPNIMKKLTLSTFVVVTFLLYSYHTQHETQSSAVTAPAARPSPAASPSGSTGGGSTGSTPASQPATTYKDGSYVGSAANAYYGNIQVKAVIQGGKITDVQFLQYPNDRSNSIAINQQAMPYLKQEAIQAQSAQVDTVSGATDTSQAFVQSLTDALAAAKS
jgi:uncharacterized protein with FMN-binding domain